MAELARPDDVLERLSGQGAEPGESPIVRVLGAREVGQALVSASLPTPAVLGLGVGVDCLHCLSMLGVSVWLTRYRRHAMISALVAAVFALAGLAARHCSL